MISSKSNSKIKEIRLLKQAKHRRDRGVFFAEGVRLVEEALRSAPHFLQMIYSPRLEENPRGVALLSLARRRLPGVEWLQVSDEVLDSLSDAQSHQGVLAVLGKKESRWEDFWKREGLVLVLCELQDPGNLGTIFRVAEAGRAAGLILSPGTLDPYGPKVVRASMGSLFRLPFLVDQNPLECLADLRSRGYRVWAAGVESGAGLWEVDLRPPTAVLFGQEGAGLHPKLLEATDGVITVPMDPEVNSLNVAVCAGLVVYEAFRQQTIKTASRKS
jgi:RNA methyltransferase, TrmH family